MCGIVGGVGLGEAVLHAACNTIAHRGPDSGAVWLDAGTGLALGHRRLAIVDLDHRSDQPMRCPTTGNVVVFNGEIYNFRALRDELAAGWRFRTSSDTEVLLAAYATWGEECLTRFVGMFAFALFDRTRRRVIMARDRIGKKPLYYTGSGGAFAFASELKALLAARPDLARDLDDEALRAYMDIGYVPGGLSIYSAVRKLPPAHLGIVDLETGQTTLRRYWELPRRPAGPRSEAEAVDELDALLQDAVRLRLEADVPVGAFLSGGLDSSLIVAIAARFAPDLVAYTAAFPGQAVDESATAARVAAQLGVRHVVLDVGAPDLAMLRRLGRQFDEPFADSSLVPTFLVSEAISRQTKVALSGDGGDELFAGYGSYRRMATLGRQARWPRALRWAAAAAHHLLAVGVPGKNRLRHLPYDGMTLFRRLTAASEEIRISPLTAAVEARLRRHPGDGFRAALVEELRRDPRRAAPPTLLALLTEVDLFSYLPDDVLVKVDRASMLASLEVRSPLLDHRVVELAFNLPDDLRMRHGVQKYLLKQVARRYLPADFPYDRKQGFTIPEADWFRGSWGDALLQLVAPEDEVLDPRRVERLVARHRRNGREGPLLFKTMMLASFLSARAELAAGASEPARRARHG